MLRKLCVVGGSLALVAFGCSSGDEDIGPAANTAEVTAPTADDEFNPGTAPNCTTAAGIDFVTKSATCAEAIEQGISASIAVGLLTRADVPSADTSMSVVCMAIQGDSPLTGGPDYVELAELLTITVCPGDVSMIEPTP